MHFSSLEIWFWFVFIVSFISLFRIKGDVFFSQWDILKFNTLWIWIVYNARYSCKFRWWRKIISILLSKFGASFWHHQLNNYAFLQRPCKNQEAYFLWSQLFPVQVDYHYANQLLIFNLYCTFSWSFFFFLNLVSWYCAHIWHRIVWKSGIVFKNVEIYGVKFLKVIASPN